MNFKKFSIATVLQAIAFTLLKIYTFAHIDFSQRNYLYLYLLVVGILATIFVRMLGIINFFEAFYIVAVWFILDSFLDLTITTHYAGYRIFATFELWLGYLVMLLCVFWLHEKFHIHVRKKLHAKHH